DCFARADRGGALNYEDRPAPGLRDDAADLAHRLPNVAEIGCASDCCRRVNAKEDEARLGERIFVARCEPEPAISGPAPHYFAKARLDERQVAGVEARDEKLVDIDRDHPVPQFGQASSRYCADMPGSNYGNVRSSSHPLSS